jgi:DNA-directed RNA polymerase I, II, and III subunit RPABC2
MSEPKSGKRMTRYELVRVIASRVEQITTGSPYAIKPDEDDSPIDIAVKELEQKKLPMMIERTLPDGTTETIRLADLLIPKKTMQHLRSIRILPNQVP